MRMLHLRSAFLFRMRVFQWTLRIAQVVLSEWRLACQVSRLIAKKQCISLLTEVFLSFQRIVQAKKDWRHYYHGKEKQFRVISLQRGFKRWQSHSGILQSEQLKQKALSSKRRVSMLKSSFFLLRNMVNFHLKKQKVRQKFVLNRFQRALFALKANVLRCKQMRQVLLRQIHFASHEALKSWNLLYRFHRKFRELKDTSVQRWIQIFIYDCWLSDFLWQWHFAVEFQIKESRAVEVHWKGLRRFLRFTLQKWRMGASNCLLERNTKLGAASSQFQITRLRCAVSFWHAQVAKAKRLKSLQVLWLLRIAKETLEIWKHHMHILRHFRARHDRQRLQCCVCALSLWRAAVSMICLETALQSWALSLWAEWTALRRRVRDEVAWQRWADGIADLFITRRLLMGLPSCFTAWSHFYRSRKAKFSLASTKEIAMQKRIVWLGFMAFRRCLALARFACTDASLQKLQVKCLLDTLQHFRRVCKIWSQCEKVTLLRLRGSRLRETRLNGRWTLYEFEWLSPCFFLFVDTFHIFARPCLHCIVVNDHGIMAIRLTFWLLTEAFRAMKQLHRRRPDEMVLSLQKTARQLDSARHFLL